MLKLNAALFALVLACGGSLMAQTPPMGGYQDAAYSTGTAYGDQIESFVLKVGTTTLMSNLNTGGAAYPYNTFYSAITPGNMVPGSSHSVEVQPGSAYSQYFTAWIDYNNDGDFLDAGEQLGTTANITHPTYGVITFVPPSGVGGVRRLRVRAVWNTAGPHDPVVSYSYGEAEDYLVNLGFAISTSSPLPTAAQGSAYNQNIQATNGTTPYNWVLPVTGTLPPGITASQSGNNLLLSGTPTTAGTFNFSVTVNDSSSPSQQSTKAFALTVVPPPAAMPFSDNFSTDKGWQLGTTWTRGATTGYSAAGPTRAEPSQDATASSSDNMIIGDTIGGDYPINQSQTYWAVSPMVNCTTAQNARLRFSRWLGNAIGTSIYIQISNNGTTWNTVWEQTPAGGQSTIMDTAWTTFTYNISQWANGFATVQIRFGVGPTGANPHVGWSIDDFEIYDGGPDMEVREGPAPGTVITNNQAVSGLRQFGSQQVSTSSAAVTFTITNNGATNLGITFSEQGANPGDFTANFTGFTNPIPPGQSSSFTYVFYPTALGVRSCTAVLTHNAGGTSGQQFLINLEGTGVAAAVGVLEVRLGTTTGPVIAHQQSPTGTPRDFGNQDIGAGPTASLTITIMNTGTGPLNLTVPDLGPTWWNQFVLDTTGFATTLAAGASTSVTIAFDPNVVQNGLDSFIRIPHTDATQTSPYEVPVIGNGTTTVTTPQATVKEGSMAGPTVTHNQAAAGTARDFGGQIVSAGPTAALSIFISNTGSQALTLGTPTKGGTHASDFVLSTTGFSTSVAPGGNTSFTIAFDPTSVGVKNATVTFTHNDPGATSPFTINVTGTGITTAAVIVVKAGGAAGTTLTNPAPATGALNFGNLDINAGPSTAVVIYIENTGTASMTLGTPALAGAGAPHFVLNTAGYSTTVAVGANTSFTVAFDPSTIGAKTANVSVTHNASGTATPFVINVAGNGILNSPIVEVREGTATGTVVTSGAVATSGGGRDCGSVDVAAGATSPITIVIVNAGNQPMTLGTPTLTGPEASQFALGTAGFSTTVAAGASTQLTVTCNPTAVGTKDAQIEFTHNDTSGTPSPFIVPVIGRGTSATGVQILTASLPSGAMGTSFSTVNFSANQGTAPYAWSMYKSTLPAGLTLSASGVLSGIPAVSGSFNIAVRVTDAGGGTDERNYTLVIAGSPLLPTAGGGGGGACASHSEGNLGPLAALAALLALLAGVRVARRA